MCGDQGILKEIVVFKKEYGFCMLVDDVYGFGIFGVIGVGVGEEQGVQDDIDLYFSIFVKFMASIGVFVGGDSEVIEFLCYNLCFQIFVKLLLMLLIIGNIKCFEMLCI